MVCFLCTFSPWPLVRSNGTPLQYSCLENPMDGWAWWAAVHEVAKSQIRLSEFTFTFHFHVLEKEMATRSSVLAWRIPGMGEPGGLPSLGSHRAGRDWSDLAALVGSRGLYKSEDWCSYKWERHLYIRRKFSRVQEHPLSIATWVRNKPQENWATENLLFIKAAKILPINTVDYFLI